MKKIISVLLACLMVLSLFAFAGCTKNNENADNADSAESQSEAEFATSNPVAVITVKDFGTITVELYPDKAPNTVNNFISLANKGFYNGLTFHRIIEGFMIQGGCPEGTGMGGPGYCVKGDFFFNGFKNELRHKRGVLSMARSSSPNSAGSQFFIMHEDAKHLDGQYAAFGKVVEGIETVDEIASIPTDYSDRPKIAMRMKRVYIEE